ncbi:unnamed protein product [Amoebophrya sp. A120]|nr:unnamed protein product [Amoebophrya sp. A120]|eukprot:GSA120T00002066001.1
MSTAPNNSDDFSPKLKRRKIDAFESTGALLGRFRTEHSSRFLGPLSGSTQVRLHVREQDVAATESSRNMVVPQATDSMPSEKMRPDDETEKSKLYFAAYAQHKSQINMLTDWGRTECYRRALQDGRAAQSCVKSKTVMDVGAGTGILSFLALQSAGRDEKGQTSGAAKVIAVEASNMARTLRQIAASNGFVQDDKLVVLQELLENVKDADLGAAKIEADAEKDSSDDYLEMDKFDPAARIEQCLCVLEHAAFGSGSTTKTPGKHTTDDQATKRVASDRVEVFLEERRNKSRTGRKGVTSKEPHVSTTDSTGFLDLIHAKAFRGDDAFDFATVAVRQYQSTVLEVMEFRKRERREEALHRRENNKNNSVGLTEDNAAPEDDSTPRKRVVKERAALEESLPELREDAASAIRDWDEQCLQTMLREYCEDVADILLGSTNADDPGATSGADGQTPARPKQDALVQAVAHLLQKLNTLDRDGKFVTDSAKRIWKRVELAFDEDLHDAAIAKAATGNSDSFADDQLGAASQVNKKELEEIVLLQKKLDDKTTSNADSKKTAKQLNEKVDKLLAAGPMEELRQEWLEEQDRLAEQDVQGSTMVHTTVATGWSDANRRRELTALLAIRDAYERKKKSASRSGTSTGLLYWHLFDCLQNIPGKVHSIVSECIGTCLVNERMFESFLHARDRFLLPFQEFRHVLEAETRDGAPDAAEKNANPGGLFPNTSRICVAPVCDEELWDEVCAEAGWWTEICSHPPAPTRHHGKKQRSSSVANGAAAGATGTENGAGVAKTLNSLTFPYGLDLSCVTDLHLEESLNTPVCDIFEAKSVLLAEETAPVPEDNQFERRSQDLKENEVQNVPFHTRSLAPMEDLNISQKWFDWHSASKFDLEKIKIPFQFVAPASAFGSSVIGDGVSEKKAIQPSPSGMPPSNNQEGNNRREEPDLDEYLFDEDNFEVIYPELHTGGAAQDSKGAVAAMKSGGAKQVIGPIEEDDSFDQEMFDQDMEAFALEMAGGSGPPAGLVLSEPPHGVVQHPAHAAAGSVISESKHMRRSSALSQEDTKSLSDEQEQSGPGVMIHGLFLWFDCQFGTQFELSSSPWNPPTHWRQVFFPFKEVIRLEAVDEICRGTVVMQVTKGLSYQVEIKLEKTEPSRNTAKYFNFGPFDIANPDYNLCDRLRMRKAHHLVAQQEPESTAGGKNTAALS